MIIAQKYVRTEVRQTTKPNGKVPLYSTNVREDMAHFESPKRSSEMRLTEEIILALTHVHIMLDFKHVTILISVGYLAEDRQ